MIPFEILFQNNQSIALIPFETAILLGIWFVGCLFFIAIVFYLVHIDSKRTHTNEWVNHFYEGLNDQSDKKEVVL